MEKVILRSYKGEATAKIIFTLVLSVLLVYWSMDGDIIIRISGARLDHGTSVLLLRILAVVMLTGTANELIKLFSVFNYGEFVLTMDDEQIVYPVSHAFRGFRPFAIQKELISTVELMNNGKGTFTINLVNAQNEVIATIPGDITPYKKIKPQELADKIHQWIN